MKTLITFTFVFLLSCFILKSNSDDLVGKWECYHREKEDGTTKGIDAFSDEEYEYTCDGLTINLKADFTGYESIGQLNFEYQRNDSILKLGNREYIIEVLTNKELVIRDYAPDKTKFFKFRHKFKKVK